MNRKHPNDRIRIIRVLFDAVQRLKRYFIPNGSEDVSVRGSQTTVSFNARLHASIRRSIVHAAFAGLVEGRTTALRPISGCI